MDMGFFTYLDNGLTYACFNYIYNVFMKKDWEEIFDSFYDNNEHGGSSRWLVSPTTVKNFITSLLRDYEIRNNNTTRFRE